MSGVDLSVVVPTHNGGHLLDQQVRAIVESAQGFAGTVEVVLSDNGSTDGAVERAVSSHRGGPAVVRSVAAHGRRGVSHARNVGLRAAASQRVAICDADDLVCPSWVPAMARAISEESPYVTGPLDVDRLNPPWARESRGRRAYEEPARFDGVVPFAHGCNVGVHGTLIDRIGGFDERLDAGGGDDIEFGARVWRAGVPLTWEPDARVAYRYRLGLREAYRQGRSYGAARRTVRALAPYLPPRERPPAPAALRRILWLVRTAPAAAVDQASRARWIWVLSQLDGEARALAAPLLGRRSAPTRWGEPQQ